jgi:FkbM family methyltransferase
MSLPFLHLREALRRRRPAQISALWKLCGTWETLRYLAQRALNLPIVSLRLPGIAQPIYLRPFTSDWTALRQVLEERDCDVPLNGEPRFIIDGGANIGLASVLLANKYPNARILAVEPHPDNALLLRLNCRGYSNVELVNSAIWSSNTYLEIANPDSDIHGGFQVREVGPKKTPASFHAVTLTDLLERANATEIDLLKLDIEGAETEIFSRNHELWTNRVKTLVIEIHGDEAGKTVRRAMMDAGEFRESLRGEKLVFQRETSAPKAVAAEPVAAF